MGRPRVVFRRPDGRGVLYRPRVPYNYYLFVRHLERGQVRWKLRRTATLLLENRSPIISVGVDRSFFASRRTALLFDDGVLKNVCIYKSSELEEVATIPLAIAENLVKLPSHVLQLRLENTNNFKQLVDTQNRLIAAQRAHLSFVQGVGDKQSAGQTPDAPPAFGGTRPKPDVVAGREKLQGDFPNDADWKADLRPGRTERHPNCGRHRFGQSEFHRIPARHVPDWHGTRVGARRSMLFGGQFPRNGHVARRPPQRGGWRRRGQCARRMLDGKLRASPGWR